MTVVFLPGTLCDERVWRAQLAACPDHRVVDLRRSATLAGMLEAVRAVEAARFVLAGFSMGGYVAQEFALLHPERVAGLAIVGASCEGYPPNEKPFARQALEFVRRGLFRGVTERRLRELLHPNAYADAGLRALIQAMAGEDAAEVYERQLLATLERRDLTAEVARIACPVMLIGGAEDPLVPPETLARTRAAYGSAELVILPECGHFIPLEKPAEVGTALAGLRRRIAG